MNDEKLSCCFFSLPFIENIQRSIYLNVLYSIIMTMLSIKYYTISTIIFNKNVEIADRLHKLKPIIYIKQTLNTQINETLYKENKTNNLWILIEKHFYTKFFAKYSRLQLINSSPEYLISFHLIYYNWINVRLKLILEIRLLLICML